MPRAKKALGQNFLTDGRVVGKITAAAESYSDDTILEVGPGRGILTRALASKAGKVITVEIDEQLIPSLYEKFSDHTNVLAVSAGSQFTPPDCFEVATLEVAFRKHAKPCK